MGCEVDRVALGKDFLPVLLLSSISIIRAMLCTHIALGYCHQKDRREKSAKLLIK